MPGTLLTTAVKSATAPDSAVSRTVNRLPQLETNVGNVERWISLAAGGYLLTRGLSGHGPGLVSTLLGGFLLYRAATGNCPGYQALGVGTACQGGRNTSIPAGHGMKVEQTVIVNKPVAEVYRFWRDLENFPRFMSHLEDVDTTTDGRSHWVARGPLGLRVEWDAEIVTDTPNEVISWKSLDSSDVDTAGSVHFRKSPSGQGTEVRVVLKYNPPGGRLGIAASKLFGESPEGQIREDLQRFKQLLETGSVASTATQRGGRS